MPGMWNQSLLSIPDLNGRPHVGAKAYFYEAGTTTPLTVFQDYDLGIEHPWPVETDGFGRFPAIFIDDGFYRARVTTEGGSLLYDVDSLPVIGPSSGEGGGGGTPVDTNRLLKTGDVKWRYGVGVINGFVRCNGRSIGSSTSGASERANADTQPLYEYLWLVDENLEVVGGRGASAADDFAANKALSLPDARGRGPFGLDNMGTSAAGRITGGTTLGATGGSETHTLTTDQIPAHTHTGTTENESEHTHGVEESRVQAWTSNPVDRFTGPGDDNETGPGTPHHHDFTTDETGGGEPHNNMPPYILMTCYMAL